MQLGSKENKETLERFAKQNVRLSALWRLLKEVGWDLSA